MHGFTGRAEDWDDCMPGAGHEAIALDLPGHGASRLPLMSFERTLRALLAAIPERVERIAGYSLGGRLALGLIAAAPERFGAATIISAHPGLDDPVSRRARIQADRQWVRCLREEGIESFVRAWESQPLFASQARLAPWKRQRQRARRLEQSAEGLAASLEQHGLGVMPPLHDAVIAYPGALTWIAGAEDAKFSAIAREIKRQRPATDLRILPGIGHNPLLECPERLAACLV
ncbi:MAG: alpha/beta fold hydrolase [Sphingobacteriia bacterium]|nr:alpha/beta fold hydrolase [Sphingobacteriia bacterium]NCC37992.1 alpha/beta fold hydrolase [Gammaproteobacteria bacterium]